MKNLKIGSLEIGFPVIQAALSGYSDAPMRRLARRFGASMALCEVFLDEFVLNVSKKSKARLYLAVQDTDHPCGAQLMGNEPEHFVAAAKRLLDFGFDLIDLNFACPVRKVLGKNRGGSLMGDPQRALTIVSKVRAALPSSVPLTVKLRKGLDEQPESREHFFELLDGLLDRGIDGITLHGRTVRQRYEGLSDWNFIREVKEYLLSKPQGARVPLIGSGDLFTAEVCMQRFRESKVDGLALARGVIGNPWLFREVRALGSGQPLPPPPSLSEQRAVIEEHYRQVEELYGEKRAATVMRKFGIRYSEYHPDSLALRRAFVECKNQTMWLAVLSRFF